MLKAALYCRVSTEIQVIEGFSIMAQLTEMRQYCKKNEIQIYDEYVDEGISGTKENRPALSKLIKESDNFDVVLVHKFDRFARKVELSAKIKSILRKNKVKVISITEPIEDSPIGFFQEEMLSVMNEYYIKNLAAEIKKGHTERARSGLHNGSIPYGYISQNEKLIIHPEESKIVKLIYEKYLNGDGCLRIARFLQQHNILTKNGKLFQYFQVNRILKNQKYIGNIEYDGKIYEGKHEPIISKEDYNMVQRELNSRNTNLNKGQPARRTPQYYKYHLIDILYCGECGGNFRITTYNIDKFRQYRNFAYICGRAIRYSGKCDFVKHFVADRFEKEIDDILIDFMQNEQTTFTPALSKKDNTIEILKNRKNKISEELTRAKNAYLGKVFELEEYREIKNKLTEENNQIDQEIKNHIPDFINTSKLQNNIKTIWDEYKNESDIVKKRSILKSVIDKITINKNGEIRIYFV